MGWWRPWRARRWASRVSDDLAFRLSSLGMRLSGPRPEFRAALRDELLRVHEAERVPAATPQHARPPIRRVPLLVRLRPWAALAAMVVATVTTASLTFATVPGDLLYPLKRAAESTLLTLTTDDGERMDREMATANARATEAAALLQAATPDSKLIDQTLDDLEDTTRAALDKAKPSKSSAKVRLFVQEQKKLIKPMIPKLKDRHREKAVELLLYLEGVGD